MTDKCEWLPSVTPIIRGETTTDYISRLHIIFDKDFNVSKPKFLGKDVIYDKNPKINNMEQAFYHLTTIGEHFIGSNNNLDRNIDYSRSEKIGWIKEIISHYDCKKGCCSGIKIWKIKKRISIFFTAENYLIVLEDRKKYFLLITAYPLNRPHEITKKLKQYEEYGDYIKTKSDQK